VAILKIPYKEDFLQVNPRPQRKATATD